MSTAPIVLGTTDSGPWRARLRLVFWGLVAVVSVYVAGVSEDRRERPLAARGGDLALYRAIVERVAAGTSYYAAYAEEAGPRGYPNASIFNWRTPLPLLALAYLPDPAWGKVLLGLLAGWLVLQAFAALADDAGRTAPAVLGAMLLTGPLLLFVLGDIYLLPVVWAGVLIGLSLVAYGRGRNGWGVAAGLAALFVRELALPYCAVAGLIALVNRRWREAAAWIAGGLLWIAFLLLHAWQVHAHLPADAQAHTHGWVCFGGLAFLVSTVQTHALLILWPRWVAALYLVAALLGFAGWKTTWGLRAGATVAGLVLMLAVAGQPFNQYWGCLTAPLLCLGVAQCPSSIATLLREARG